MTRARSLTVPRRLVKRCWDLVKQERDGILETHCLLDRRTLRPRRGTLDRRVRPYVRELEALLAELDAVLQP